MSSEPGDSRIPRRSRPTLVGSSLVTALGALCLAPLALLAQASLQPDPGAAGLWIQAGLAVLGLIALNGAFVAGEAALGLLNEADLHANGRNGAIQHLWQDRQRFAAACFLSSQAARACMVLVAVVPAVQFAPSVESWGVPAPASLFVAAVLLAIPIAALNLVAGEVVPRAFASSRPVRTALSLRWLMHVAAALGTPLVKLALAVAGLVTRQFGARATLSSAGLAEEKIRGILAEAGAEDGMHEEERTMIHSVFEFGDTVAREVMTPRVDMDSVTLDATLQDIASVVEATGHSRLPVCTGSEDNIVGIVHAKDVLRALVRNEEATVRDIMREPYFVPENKNLHDLLTEMRANKTQIVVVQDEFGGTAGIATVEDIVEEVVGEIVDEYDDEQPEIVPLGEGFLVEGKTNLYDLNEAAGTHFASEEFDTAGGYVFGLFGRQPSAGESIESDGYRFTVVETDGRRIVRLQVEAAGHAAGVRAPARAPQA
jgi:putative hemolysin